MASQFVSYLRGCQPTHDGVKKVTYINKRKQYRIVPSINMGENKMRYLLQKRKFFFFYIGIKADEYDILVKMVEHWTGEKF